MAVPWVGRGVTLFGRRPFVLGIIAIWIVGALMMLAGFGWLAFLIPAVAKHAAIGIEALGIAAEGLLMLWLLAKGVNVEKWQRQARGARN